MSRKRACKIPKVAPVNVKKEEPKIELVPNKPKIKLTALSNPEMEIIQNMANLSATYGGLLKQQAQYDAALIMLKIRREQIVKGELKLPMMVKVTDRLQYAESNKDKVLKLIDDDIKNVTLARDGLQGTIEYRRDAFKESLLKTISALKLKVGNLQVENVMGFNKHTTPEIKEKEKEALEKEFDKELEKECVHCTYENGKCKHKKEVKKDGS